MKLKYHNKLEIEVGGRSYVSYNKVLRSLYNKIASFEPYATYFSLGSGLVELADSDTKLGNYLMSLKTETSDICCDPEKGVYYVKKTATIDSNDSTSFSFTEIGISSTNSNNPDVYNHILIKDENGEIVEVVRNAGESLVIKLTIFLELNTDDNTFLTYGDNNLIKLLLGEELADKTIYVVRGTNMTENLAMKRNLPTFTKKHKATLLVSTLENGDVELSVTAKLGEGATREIILIINDEVVARTNLMNVRAEKNIISNYTSNSLRSAFIDEYVSDVTEVMDADSNVVSDYVVESFAKSLGDEITHDLLSGVDNNTTRFKSIDGNMIAFLTQNKLIVLKSTDYELVEIHTNAIGVGGIYNVCLLSNYVLVFKNISPYIEIYKIINNVCEKQPFFKVNYDESIYSYDFSDVKAIELKSGEIVIGAILESSKIGLALKIQEDKDGYNLIRINQCSLTSVDKILSCTKTNTNDAKLIFLSSSNNDPITPYALQVYSSEFSSVGNYSEAETFMTASDITAHGDFLILHLQKSPYVYSYDTTNFDRVSFKDNTFAGNCNFSHDMRYVISNDNNGEITMYLCLSQEDLNQMDISSITGIGTENILSVEIMKNMLLVFTNDTNKPVRVILLDNKYTAVSCLPNANTDYTISFNKYDLLGSNEYEGVQLNLRFTF